MPKTGLVLTGGGLKGICGQTGALLALEPLGLHFDAVIGTSAGAIVGSYLTSGVTPTGLADILATLKDEPYLVPVVSTGKPANLFQELGDKLQGTTGYFRGDSLLGFLDATLPADQQIEDCDPRFYITLTNISRQIPEVRGEGSLALAARASSAIPIVFEAQKIGDDYFVDGGAINNIPVDELDRKSAQDGLGLEQYFVLTTLGVVKRPTHDNSFMDKDFTPIHVLRRTIEAVATDQHMRNMTASANKPICAMQVETDSIDIDEPEKAEHCIEQARQHASELMEEPKIKAFLDTIPRN